MAAEEDKNGGASLIKPVLDTRFTDFLCDCGRVFRGKRGVERPEVVFVTPFRECEHCGAQEQRDHDQRDSLRGAH